MAKRFSSIPEVDFGGGIDQQSSENNIQPGFVEDAVDVDFTAEGTIRKRKGYQGFAGNLPVRAKSITSRTGELDFTLDDDVDLINVRSQPILVRLRNKGPTIDTVSTVFVNQYYSGFSSDPRINITPASTLLPASSYNLGHSEFWVGVTESTSSINSSNNLVLTNSIEIDTVDYHVDISVPVTIPNAFVYYLDAEDSVSSSFYTNELFVYFNGVEKVIDAATHQLNTSFIMGKVFEKVGAEWHEIIPDVFKVYANGDVGITFASDFLAPGDIRVSLHSISPDNIRVTTVGGTETKTLPILGLNTAFLFFDIFMEDGADLIKVIPESIEVDDSNGTADVTWINHTGSSATFKILFTEGFLRTNVLTVTNPSIASAVTSSDVEVTIWGLDHSEIYGTTRPPRAGWTTHLDTYSDREGNTKIITALGGQPYASDDMTGELSNMAPQLYPWLSSRVQATSTLGPLFLSVGETSNRKDAYVDGYITDVSILSGLASVSTATYNTGTGWTEYTVALDSPLGFDSLDGPQTLPLSLSSLVSTTTGLEDWLTVQSMGMAALNGRFKIRAVTGTLTTITFSVENPDVTDSDLDELDAGGLAGVFTGRIAFQERLLTSGDILRTSPFGPDTNIEVISTKDQEALVADVFTESEAPAGLRIEIKRVSPVIRLRTSAFLESVTSMVRGDMVKLGDITRLFRVKSVRTSSTEEVSIVGSGTVATVSDVLDTSELLIGQQIQLIDAGVFTGVHVVDTITTATSFTFVSTIMGSVSDAYLLGKCIEVDEAVELEGDLDNLSPLTVPYRWGPITIPYYDSSTIHRDTAPFLWDQGKSNTVRSVMSSDNMYFLNDSDEVYKYDGTSAYRAGFYRWDPHVMIMKKTTGGAIPSRTATTTPTLVKGDVAYVPTGDEEQFSVGDRLSHVSDIYTIRSISSTPDTPKKGVIKVDRNFVAQGSLTALTAVTSRRYYFRLNMIDRNNNLMASAISGSQEYEVQFGGPTTMKLKVSRFPGLGDYDYNRLELQIYGTPQGGGAFYLIGTLDEKFESTDSDYILFDDAKSDISLSLADDVNKALSIGSTLGLNWSAPLRGKYITEVGNRLILGNVKEYPTADVRILSQVTNGTSAANLSGLVVTLRKDSTDSIVAPDFVTGTRGNFHLGRETGGPLTVVPLAISAISPGVSVVISTAGNPFPTEQGYVYIYRKGSAAASPNMRFNGLAKVIASSAGVSFTVDIKTSDVSALSGTDDATHYAYVTSEPTAVPVLLETTTLEDFNLQTIEEETTDPTGEYATSAMRRLRGMINHWTRLNGENGWATAVAGEVNSGSLRLEVPGAVSTHPSISFSSYNQANFLIGVNNTIVSATTPFLLRERSFSSRVIASFRNYPEIFDNPAGDPLQDNNTILDVDPSNGQAITGIMPFFGDSVFGSGVKESLLIVFKEQSIYLANLASNSIQKLESQGLGCTAPYSIASTRDGIMFANESGIFRLTRQLTVEYVGQKMERFWEGSVNKDYLADMAGHHYALGRKYKLSHPLIGETENSQVLVYDHTREYKSNGFGSWTRYSSHPAIAWTNSGEDAYFASTTGRVFSIRNDKDTFDYRDDSSSIQSSFLLRAMDFGASGIRKVFNHIISHFRDAATLTGVIIQAAVDLKDNFTEGSLDPLSRRSPIRDGLSDEANSKVRSIRSAIQRSRGIYLQLRYKHDKIDEAFELTKVDYLVAGLETQGTEEAADD